MERRRRISILTSSSTCLGALAALFATLPLYVYYPLIPYLRFELAEIPVVLSLLILGPEPAIFSSVIYWAVLLLVGEFSPIGPTMKFVAVFTMLIGLWLGFKISKNSKMGVFLGSCLGCALRAISMTIFNYIILVFMFPEFLRLATASVSTALGIEFSSQAAALLMIFIFTAIYNVLHVILSVTPAYLLVKYIVEAKRGRIPIIGKTWYIEVTKAASRQAPQRS